MCSSGSQGSRLRAYRLVDLRARLQKNGTVAVSGRAVRADGAPAPSVVLLSYRLTGTVTDASARPVQGATVVTRTTDRDFGHSRCLPTRAVVTFHFSLPPT